MATDARISTSLPSHPKTKKLVRQLGAEAGWSLICLILWAAANRSDGDLSGMSDEDIELASDWDGEAGAFIGALRRIRFADGGEGDTSIHDWDEHQPWAAGSGARSLKAKWNAVKRHHGEHAADREVPEYAAIRQASSKQAAQEQHAQQDATQHASSTTPACSSPSPSPIRLPSVSFPTPTSGGVGGVEPPKPPKPPPDPAADASATPRGSRLSEDWVLPKDWGEWALAEYPQWTSAKVRLEAAKFRDTWVSKAGQAASKRDWRATWRNWCRDDLAHRDDPKTNGHQSATDRRVATLNALTGKNRDHERPGQRAGEVVDVDARTVG